MDGSPVLGIDKRDSTSPDRLHNCQYLSFSKVCVTTSAPTIHLQQPLHLPIGAVFASLRAVKGECLLDGDARAWATPTFFQLTSVQIGIQGATTPFADEKAFLKAFKAHFGNLDNAAAAQGPVDRSGYGNLELHDKYLSSIPSHVYHKLELETFATWQDADKRATEVEQILDVSRARWPELNNFFSAQGRGRGGARGGAPSSHGASASINAAVGKGNFPGTCFGCGKQGYRRFECPNYKKKIQGMLTDLGTRGQN
ncbi:predicted protein [Postia placenta Mad-698-R]|nr:predicted protein [Postia placenta Mad-698-R]